MLVIHHPGGLPKHVTRGQCRGRQTWPPMQQKIELFHLCDTLPGSSGAPIFSDNDNALIGIHRAGPTVTSLNSTNFGIMISAIDSKLIPLSTLEGSVESAKRLVTRTILNSGSQLHIGDENFRSKKWSTLTGSCHSFNLSNTGTKPERLIINARVYGAENTSIILNRSAYPFANQQIPIGKKRPKLLEQTYSNLLDAGRGHKVSGPIADLQ